VRRESLKVAIPDISASHHLQKSEWEKEVAAGCESESFCEVHIAMHELTDKTMN
jgi:hypothetical protein